MVKEDVYKQEETIRETMDDIHSVLKLAKVSKPKVIKLFVAEPWKYKLYELLEKEMKSTRDIKALIAIAMKHEDLRKHGKEATKIIPRAVKSGVESGLSYDSELKVISESKEFFKREFNCEVMVELAAESKEQKARQARPGKPAILV